MHRRVRVLLVGAGRWGRVHARTVAEAGGVLVGVVDVRREAAEGLARLYNARWFTSLDEALEWGGFDAVIVAVPPLSLASVAAKVIDAGFHVLVEKPVAASYEEAMSLARLAERRGIVALAGYLLRFHPLVRLAARLVSRIRPVSYLAERIVPRPSSARRWPVELDLAVHDIDVMLYLLGGELEAESITRIDIGGGDGQLFYASYSRDGLRALVVAGDVGGLKRRVFELHGRGASLVADYDAHRMLLCEQGSCFETSVSSEPPLTLEHRVFYTMVARVEGFGESRHPLESVAATLQDAALVLKHLGL